MTDLYRDSRLDPDVEVEIRDLVISGKAADPRQLQATIRKGHQGWSPDIRVLRQRFARYRPRNDSGDWSMRDADPDDAALVLDTLAAVHMDTFDPDEPGRQVRRFTQAEGDWIVRVRRARPDLVPAFGTGPWQVRAVQVWQFARRYLWHDENGVPTTALDLELAMLERAGRVSVLPGPVPVGSTLVGGRRRRDLEARLAAQPKEGHDDGTTR